MFNFNFGFDAALIFLISALVCALVLVTQRHHLAMANRRSDTKAVQAAHRRPTPRIGGLALIAALVPMALLIGPELAPRFWLFALSLAPVFLAGLAEDLGWHVSPRNRLIAAALSSLVAIALLDIWVPRSHVPGLDLLFQWAPFAILFTLFACAGICNGFNLIDGINGLAAGVGTIAALAMATIAVRAGIPAMVEPNLMIAAALMGFLVFNFPWGRIFLGDAGAYSLGHILAWFSVGLMNRAPDLTPWAVLLVFFWPIADTFFAIYRRRRAGRPTGLPDRLHFHQLVMRSLEITLMGRDGRHVANPLATLILLPMAAVPALFGVLLWDKPAAAFLALLGFSTLFVATYLIGLRIVPRRRRRLSFSLAGSESYGEEGTRLLSLPIQSTTRPMSAARGDGQ